MKSDIFWLLVIALVAFSFLGFIFYESLQDDKKCIEKGGTNVRTTQGYECLKVQKL